MTSASARLDGSEGLNTGVEVAAAQLVRADDAGLGVGLVGGADAVDGDGLGDAAELLIGNDVMLGSGDREA